MKTQITSVSCYITKDDYLNGMDIQSFHSYNYPLSQLCANRKELLNFISNHIHYLVGINDIELIDNSIRVNTMVSYKPLKDWNEFPIATKDEINKWKNGEMELYCAEYIFDAHNVLESLSI